MKTPLEILVLGDSTLSSLGAVYSNALDHVMRRRTYTRDLHFLNPSAAGMTAADAWIHFVEVAQRRPLDGVVLYLGNCDACAFGPIKPRAPRRLHAAYSRLRNAVHRRRHPLVRRNPPYVFVPHDVRAGSLRRCVPPEDHRWFVDRIVRHASARQIHVFVMLPASKVEFPPCNNTGNALFYKIAGVSADLPLSASGPANRLVEALRLQETARHDEALTVYTEVMTRHPDDELGWIAMNNAAVLRAEREEFDAAEQLLDRIPVDHNTMGPIPGFNRALVARARGEEDEARSLLHRARESDSGTYRVTEAYGDVLAALPSTTPFVHTIDLRGCLGEADFIDYCHPTEAGHEKIGERMAAAIASAFELPIGDRSPRVTYLPLNPDRYAGAHGGFFEHFGIVSRPRLEFGPRAVTEAAQTAYPEILERAATPGPDPVRRTIDRILAHPLCGSSGFLRAAPPTTALDQGQLPELYFLRHLIELYRRLPQEARVRERLGRSIELLPQPDRLAVWWNTLKSEANPVDLPLLERLAATVDASVILSRTACLLRRLIAHEPLLFSRYRTITYWFLRESLVFGTTSHHSMLFDRLGLHHVTSSCLYLLWFHAPTSPAAVGCENLIRIVDSALEIHARYLLPHQNRVHAFPAGRFEDYRAELQDLLRRPELEAHSAPPSPSPSHDH